MRVAVDINKCSLATLAEAASGYKSNVSTSVGGRVIISAPSDHIRDHGGRPRLIKKIKQRFSIMALLGAAATSGYTIKKQSLSIDGEDIYVLLGNKNWNDVAFTVRPDGTVKTNASVRDDLHWAITKELIGKGVIS